jgi:hypothetical protein
MATLLDEQVPDGHPNMFVQQLGSGVHHPEEQRKVVITPRCLVLLDHRFEVKDCSNSKGGPNTRKLPTQEEKIPPVKREINNDRYSRPTHLPIGMEGPIGP